MTRIEALESENRELKAKSLQASNASLTYTVINFTNNDELIRLNTGFQSYEAFPAFFEFLGPAIHELKYWGEKHYERKQQCKKKLSSLDQFL